MFPIVKQGTKRVLAYLFYTIGLVDAYARFSKGHGVVLMYHRVLDATEISDAIHPGMYVTSEVFAQHLEYLSRKYSVVTLDQLQDWIQGKIDLPKTPCAITFDDGWGDNYRNAFPLLKKNNIPATVFLITDQIGGPEMLTWDQAREMEAEGISFGSHTATHAILKAKTREEIHRELKESKRRLQKELSHPLDWFCFPNGEYDETALEFVKEFYIAALTVNRGVVGKGDDPFQIRRIGIHNDVSMTVPLFACRLLSIF
jgi:peptidoglycan/xylan/chitin deacetylase (PgdA/CDA1 family)